MASGANARCFSFLIPPRSRPLRGVSALSPPASRDKLIYSTTMNDSECLEGVVCEEINERRLRVAFAKPLSLSLSRPAAPRLPLSFLTPLSTPPRHAPLPQVQLSGGAHKASAVTDEQGYFELDIAGVSSPSVLSGSLLRLDRGGGGGGDGGDGGGDDCQDTAVGLPPPISLGALVPIHEKGNRFFFVFFIL